MGGRLTLHAMADETPTVPSPLIPQTTFSSTASDQTGPVPHTPAENKFPNNPGTFEELHKSCKELLPQVFEGAKLIVSKGLTNHFQISHTLSLNAFQPSSYKFGATYVGSKEFGPQEMYPVLLGDIDANANLNANIIHHITDVVRMKFVTQIQKSKWVATQATTDYRGENFTLSGTVGNPDLFNKSGVFVFQYLQNVFSGLCLGTELLYQRGPQIPGGEISVFSLASKYSCDKWTLSATVSPMVKGAHISYHHRLSDELQVVAEVEATGLMNECVSTIGYQLEIPSADVTFKAQLDSNWTIGAVLEKKLQPLPFSLALSAHGNQVKSQYRIGMGLIVGS